MFEKSEEELGFWFAGLHAALGVSGSGFEGGSLSVWDAARSNREHIARWWGPDRQNVPRYRLVAPLVEALTAEAHGIALAAWVTCSASYFVRNHFANRDFQAPLVGLGLLCWYELKPDETRAPYQVVAQWEIDLKSPEADEFKDDRARRKQSQRNQQASRLLEPVRWRTHAKYDDVVKRYDSLRITRDEANGSTRRARREARRARNETFLAELRDAAE
jgi:hypothetical protein